jgi:hypothetical protein
VTEPEQPTTLHFIVPSPDGQAILVQRHADTGRLHLPEGSIPRGHEINAPTRAAADELLGSGVPLLRLAPVNLSWDHGTADIVVETESLQAAPPDEHTWRPLAGLQPQQFESEAIRGVVGRWLDEQRRGTLSPKRPSWSRPGFVAQASEWIAAQLDAAGMPLLEPPRLTSLWGIAAFFEGQTDAGKVFFKACAAVFATEPQITLALHRALPGVGPDVVAIEPERRWLLMRDVGGAPLGDAPPERRADGLTAFGAIQRAWFGATARLPASERIELEDRTLARLAETLPALVDDPVLSGLEPELRTRLRDELPRFVDACHEIIELGPGSALVHGDFHPWNVHVNGERTPIIDWSDAAIGHPFFDLPTYLGRTKDLPLRRRILWAYLSGWAGDHDPERLERAARLGLVLGSLHQVESYRRIMESLDPDDTWDLRGGAPAFARRALGWLDMGLDSIETD